MSDDLRIIKYKALSALLELADLSQSGPMLRIVHRFAKHGAECLPGEEIFAAFVAFSGRETQLRLSLSGRIVLDYLARHRRFAQSATQIAAGIHDSEFYRKHAANGSPHIIMTRRIPRSAVKVHVARLRRAFALAFHKAGFFLDPRTIIISEGTVTNEVLYRIKAVIEWVHVDLVS